MMKLYQEHGVNPLGGLVGCLPLIVQIPVLTALYWVSGTSTRVAALSCRADLTAFPTQVANPARAGDTGHRLPDLPAACGGHHLSCSRRCFKRRHHRTRPSRSSRPSRCSE